MHVGRSWAICCVGCSKPSATALRASTTSTTSTPRSEISASPSGRAVSAIPSPRMAITASTLPSWPRTSRTRPGPRRQSPAQTPARFSDDGPASGCGQVSRKACSVSVCASTCGPARDRSTATSGWGAPSTSSERPVTSMNRTAPPGSGRRPSVTTRTGWCIGPMDSQPISPPTSATSPRSSHGASTSWSISGERTITAPWRATGQRRRHLVSTRRPCTGC